MCKSTIKKLPQEAIRMLQSGIVITDAVQCVVELVYNAIDAKATSIVVRIDVEKYKIQVTDNGTGMSRVDLNNFGEKYMTSKYQNYCNSVGFTTYGFKGQAISSLLDVCKILKVETKTKKDETILVKVFENKVSLPILSEVKNTGVGTTISVEDFMWALPVRRKRINELFDLEEIKTQLKYLALVHYKISFSLRNENKNSTVFQTQSTSSILASVKNIFGTSVSKLMKDVKQRYKSIKVSGLVSKKQQTLINLQLIYVNKRLITKGVIHKFGVDLINKYISKNHSILSSASAESFTLMKFKSSFNSIFILEISCPISQYELFTNMRKCTVEFTIWKDVLKALQMAIKEVFYCCLDITDNSFQTNKIARKEKKPCQENRKRRGTSLLLNAIKGVPVKRYRKANQCPKKSEKKVYLRSKAKDFSAINNQHFLKETKNSKTKMDQKKYEITESKIFKKSLFCDDETIDSLESPIPKKKFKAHMQNDLNFSYKSDFNNDIFTNPNKLFFKFYKWLKKEFDSNFIKFRENVLKYNGKNNCLKFEDFAIPKKFFLEHDKTCEKQVVNMFQKNMNILDNELKSISSNVLISQSKNIIASIGEKPSEKFEFVKVDRFHHSGDDANNVLKYLFSEKNSEKNNEKFKEAPCLENGHLTSLGNSEDQQLLQKKQNPSLMQNLSFSPDDSDEFFLNCLNFRNFADSFECPPALNDKKNLFFSANYLESWTSHYHESSAKNLTLNKSVVENTHFVSLMEKQSVNEIKSLKRPRSSNHEFSFCVPDTGESRFESSKSKYSCKESKPQSQSNVTTERNLFLLKKDAIVQTEVMDTPETFRQSNLEHQDTNYLPLLQSCQPELNTCDYRVSPKKVLKEKEILPLKSSSYTLSVPENSDQYIYCSQKAKPARINEKINDGKSDACVSSKGVISGIQTDSLCRLKNSNLPLLKNSAVPQSNSSYITETIVIENVDLSYFKSETPKFHLTSRLNCIPKGLSPFMANSSSVEIAKLTPSKKLEVKSTLDSNKDKENLLRVKWINSPSDNSVKPSIPDGIIDEMRQKALKNMMNSEATIPSASLSYCAIKVHNLLHSFAFTKELLSDVQIIGQLDKKFIVAKMKVPVPQKKELITLFDQHAVDERIKLEKIINENVLKDGKILSTFLNPAIECKMNKSFVHIVSNSNDKLLNLGLSCKAVDEKTIIVEKIPSYLAEKYLRNGNNNSHELVEKVIQDLIADAVNELTETRGVLSKVPRILYNLFCSEACHSAIRFNKFLTNEDMINMVNELKNCKLPFQCAHGRPSVIPIIDLKDFNDLVKMTAGTEDQEISFEKVENFMRKNKKCLSQTEQKQNDLKIIDII